MLSMQGAHARAIFRKQSEQPRRSVLGSSVEKGLKVFHSAKQALCILRSACTITAESHAPAAPAVGAARHAGCFASLSYQGQ
jgi:hypothetical protein